jgi:hypothetical protein
MAPLGITTKVDRRAAPRSSWQCATSSAPPRRRNPLTHTTAGTADDSGDLLSEGRSFDRSGRDIPFEVTSRQRRGQGRYRLWL